MAAPGPDFNLLLNPKLDEFLGKKSTMWILEICQARHVKLDPVDMVQVNNCDPPVFKGIWKVNWPGGRVFEGKYKYYIMNICIP